MADQPLTQFSDWIKTQASGTTDDEMTAALSTVVEAVHQMEKKGKVTLELTVEPAGSGGRNVYLAGKVTAKPPEPLPMPSIFFVGDHGSLHREDPYQKRMFADARDIDADTGEIRESTTSEED